LAFVFAFSGTDERRKQRLLEIEAVSLASKSWLTLLITHWQVYP